MKIALVTGATGLLGSHLVNLLLESDVQVRILVRPSSDIRHLAGLPVDIFSWDAGKQAALRQAVAGCHWIFHCAGHVLPLPFTAERDGRGKYQSANVDLTEALLEAGLEAKVERFLFAGTANVYSPKTVSPIAEDAPVHPVLAYGISKLQAEDRVRAYQAYGLPATIVRPAVIYGPRDRHFSPFMLRLAKRPILPLVGGGRYRFDLVYVQDVAELMWMACRRQSSAGRVYNCGSNESTSLRAFVETIGAVSGRSPHILSISPAMVKGLAALARPVLARLVPGSSELLAGGLDYLGKDSFLDMTRARVELGFSPRFSLFEGVRLTWSYFNGRTVDIHR